MIDFIFGLVAGFLFAIFLNQLLKERKQIEKNNTKILKNFSLIEKLIKQKQEGTQ